MTRKGPDTRPVRCHCGLPAPYDECCGRFHRGDAKAPTAERLMRSRYSAFCVGDAAYLMRTWHPSTRPTHIDFGKGVRWQGLEVIKTVRGSYLDSDGTVHFRAHYIERKRPAHIEENSRFVFEDGAWLYVGPLTAPPRPSPAHRRTPRH